MLLRIPGMGSSNISDSLNPTNCLKPHYYPNEAIWISSTVYTFSVFSIPRGPCFFDYLYSSSFNDIILCDYIFYALHTHIPPAHLYTSEEPKECLTQLH